MQIGRIAGLHPCAPVRYGRSTALSLLSVQYMHAHTYEMQVRDHGSPGNPTFSCEKRRHPAEKREGKQCGSHGGSSHNPLSRTAGCRGKLMQANGLRLSYSCHFPSVPDDHARQENLGQPSRTRRVPDSPSFHSRLRLNQSTAGSEEPFDPRPVEEPDLLNHYLILSSSPASLSPFFFAPGRRPSGLATTKYHHS